MARSKSSSSSGTRWQRWLLIAAIVVIGAAIFVMTSPPRKDVVPRGVEVNEGHGFIEAAGADPDAINGTVSAETLPPVPEAPGFITLFGAPPRSDMWYVSKHTNGNHNFLGVDWMEDNVSTSLNGLTLQIARKDDEGLEFGGAEIQTQNRYGFGRYEVIMRPARGSGLVSSFFTYIGPWFDAPHDEIDFEFLGSDTTKVFLNYFRDGRTGEDRTVQLPFDAADADHLYAFEWSADRIAWYVDGEQIYETQPGDPRIPQAPSKIIMNVWTGQARMAGWHGRPTFEDGASASYSCVSFLPEGENGRTCADVHRYALALRD